MKTITRKQELEAKINGFEILPYVPKDEPSQLHDRLQMAKLVFEDALGEFKIFREDVEYNSGAVSSPNGIYKIEYQLEGFVPDYYLWSLDTFKDIETKLNRLGMGDVAIGFRGKGQTYHKLVDAITGATWKDKIGKDEKPIRGDGLKKVKYIEVRPILEAQVIDQRFCMQTDDED